MKHGTRLKVSTPLRMRIIVWCLLSVSLSLYICSGLRLYPFAGFGYEHWSRDDAVGSWHSINFPYAAVAGGADYGSGFFKVGVLMPFATTADTAPIPNPAWG